MNESKHPGPKLFHWVDAMKTMGMFFIIYGHLFSYGYPYVYAFNVPVFFILSGFLFKEDQPHPSSGTKYGGSWSCLCWRLAC